MNRLAALFDHPVLRMMIIPLPPFLLDLLFTFNIALALVVMMAAAYTRRPLDFATFPTVLLLTTLMRLSLNVASTRAVLTQGHTGPAAAGKVIESFGHFVIGGNFAVGLIVFSILVVINFVVVTKGAGRIAEVAARFTLDAMPGKQMAIDADLNTGAIDDKEARRRRTEISQEADFYGAMDGASKFVRGDAVAGILIMFINVIGGLAIGMLQHDLSFATATGNYVLLTIGDGLVAQIPALVISIGAGLRIRGALAVAARAARPAGSGAGGGRAGRAAVARGQLGRHRAGRCAGAGGRLPADSAGRPERGRRAAEADQGDPQEIRAGHRIPSAPGTHPGQPGAEAEPVPDAAQRGRDRRRRGLQRDVARDQPGRRDPDRARHGDPRPGLRSSRDLDRRADTRISAGAGIHGGRLRHRGRHACQSPAAVASRAADGSRRGAGPDRSHRQASTQAGRGPGAQADSARNAAKGALAIAGSGQRSCGVRTGTGRSTAARGRDGGQAPGGCRPESDPAGAGPAAPAADAPAAARRAAAAGAGPCRNSGDQHDPRQHCAGRPRLIDSHP